MKWYIGKTVLQSPGGVLSTHAMPPPTGRHGSWRYFRLERSVANQTRAGANQVPTAVCVRPQYRLVGFGHTAFHAEPASVGEHSPTSNGQITTTTRESGVHPHTHSLSSTKPHENAIPTTQNQKKNMTTPPPCAHRSEPSTATHPRLLPPPQTQPCRCCYRFRSRSLRRPIHSCRSKRPRLAIPTSSPAQRKTKRMRRTDARSSLRRRGRPPASWRS